MILKAYYSSGRIDIFDTDHMIDCAPQPGNLLTNYTLDLGDVNEDSLWLRSYYYEATEEYKNELDPKGFPVARRRDGWSFLVADAEDIRMLNRLTVDGETVLVQMAGELVDAAVLSWAYDVAVEYNPMVIAACGFFSKRLAEDGYAPGQTIPSTIGVPQQILDWISGSLNDANDREARFQPN